MAFQLSPGVNVKEIDATNVVPAVSSSIGGTVGAFEWGPVSKVTTISSEKQLVEVFGKPTDLTAKYFLPAAGFLQYGSTLKVVRAADLSQNNANAQSSSESVVKNEEDYENLGLSDGSNNNFGSWIAKYPGALGNGLEVHTASGGLDDSSWAAWTYKGQFSSRPETSEQAELLGNANANDEMHVVVVDGSGLFSGTAGTVLEVFEFVSQASNGKKTNGSTNYYVDVINSSSKYVWFASHDSLLTEAGSQLTATQSFTGAVMTADTLGAGADDQALSDGEIQLALDMFKDADTVDVNLLFGALDTVTTQNTNSIHILSIATARKDCVSFVSPPVVDSVGATNADNIITWANGLTSTSYGVSDSSALYVYDKYNDKFRYIPAYGHIAGLCANTDNVADTWFSPAGQTRGAILGVTKLAFNPNSADRDALYQARVNPIVAFAGEGIQLFGDKTLLSRPSAFDRINVRRLFIVMEKAIAKAAKAQLFEFNDEFTQAQFRNMVEPFLRDIKGRRGVTDFSVICDSTNNTGEVVDNNRFVADIYVKPARSINYITLNFIATRTGVDFSEIAGS